MTGDQINEFGCAEPFRPFDLYLADGGAVRIGRPERLLATPTQVVLVGDDGGFKYLRVVDVVNIKHVPFGEDDLPLCSLDAWL